MAGADGITAHSLQLGELTVERILIEGGTKAAEVVVLTDTVDLHVRTIEPEARLRIELKVAETDDGPHLVDNRTAKEQLRAKPIDIRSAGRPVMQVLPPHAERRAHATSAVQLTSVSSKDGITNAGVSL